MSGIPIAIIGFGMAGQIFHAPLIGATDDLRLVAVSTSRTEQVPEGVRAASAEEIIGDPSIALVVIATPNATHTSLADAALRAGKHVVVDKPFALLPKEAEGLIATARQTGRLLTAFHNRRWDSDFLTVRKLLAEARLGRLVRFEANWDRFRPDVGQRWRESAAAGGGLLYDLGPHLIDQALLLFGRPDAVSADVEAQRVGATADDYFALTLLYGRTRVILSASSLAAEPRPRFALHGTGGSFAKFGLDPQEDALKSGAKPLDPGFGIEPENRFGTITFADGSSEAVVSERGDYLAFYRGVLAALRDNSPPPVAAEDALEGLRIMALARASSTQGRRLPLQPAI